MSEAQRSEGCALPAAGGAEVIARQAWRKDALLLRLLSPHLDATVTLTPTDAATLRLGLLGLTVAQRFVFPDSSYLRLLVGQYGIRLTVSGSSEDVVVLGHQQAAVLAQWIGRTFPAASRGKVVPFPQATPQPLPPYLGALADRAFAPEIPSDALLILADAAQEASLSAGPALAVAWTQLAELLRAAAPGRAAAPLPRHGEAVLAPEQLRSAARTLEAYGTADVAAVSRLLLGMAATPQDGVA